MKALIFGKQYTPLLDDTLTNTFIGNVASEINTPTLLASKMQYYLSGTAFSAADIKNFTIVGNNIKCYITVDYQILVNLPTTITYYYDDGNYFKKSQLAFRYGVNFTNFRLLGLITEVESSFNSTKVKVYDLPSVTSLGFDALGGSTDAEVINLPQCVNYGISTSQNGIFNNIKLGCRIYAHPSMATINAGGMEGDLAYAINTRQAIVTYVQNTTKPSVITNLTASEVYATALRVTFTAPSSSNAISFYELYVNGVYTKRIVSGEYVTGLSPNTAYKIEVKTADIYYNTSNSNVLELSTLAAYYTDSDAVASITAKGLTGAEAESEYLLITQLKSNSLYVKTQAIYTFKGTTAAQHKFNSKNPIDTDAAFRLVFTGAATFSDLGYQLDGSSYANTKLIPSVSQTLNSNGMTIVCGTDLFNSGDNWAIAAYNSGTQNSIMSLIGNGALNLNGARVTGSTSLGQKGIHTAAKQSSTVSKTFKNGVLKLTGTGGGALPTSPFYIGAIGSINYGYIRERIQMAIIHEGLSDAEVSLMHSIIDFSETIAGRKTW